MTQSERESQLPLPLYTIDGVLSRLNEIIGRLCRAQSSVSTLESGSKQQTIDPSVYSWWPDAPDAYIQRHGSEEDKAALAERDRLKDEKIGQLSIGGGMVRKYVIPFGSARSGVRRSQPHSRYNAGHKGSSEEYSGGFDGIEDTANSVADTIYDMNQYESYDTRNE